MSLRTTIYRTLEATISTLPEIRHFALWNHNVEFIEQEEAWERPAVFVEFLPIQWKSQQPQHLYTAELQVNLHLVTDYTFTEDALEAFNLCDKLHHMLSGLSGEGFRSFDLMTTYTNHNHEEMLESISTYRCTLLHYF